MKGLELLPWLLLQGYRVGVDFWWEFFGEVGWFPDLGIWVEDAQKG
jgi:hypothetical protein